MLVTFHNLEVSIEAADPKAAYARLCDVLADASPNADWHSDTYSTEAQPEPRETNELWGQ